MSDALHIGAATVVGGDCLTSLRGVPTGSVDAVVTDPPYGLSKTDHRHVVEALTRWVAGDRDFVPHVAGGGFMGQGWDSFVPPPAVWDEVLRVLKPGGHLLTFAGSRTIGLMEMSVRLAGFEIRDSIAWLNAEGFPKSHTVAKQLTGPEAEQWAGWGTALKPAFEPIIMARKPLAGTVAENVVEHRVGALNIDASRIATNDRFGGGAKGSSGFVTGYDKPGAGGFVTGSAAGRHPANVIFDEHEAAELDANSAPVGKATSADPLAGNSRFFFVAKATKDERIAITREEGTVISHPTVKPLALMRYLITLVTPPGGVVLDPYAGSGTTLAAATLDGFASIGFERDPDFLALIEARLRRAEGGTAVA